MIGGKNMEQQTQKLPELIVSLLSGIRKYGIKEISVKQYETICRQIKKFADEKGLDEYTQEFADEYEAYVTGESDGNGISLGYLSVIKRILRLLGTLAQNGEVDFKPNYIRKKYIVSDSAQELVEDILNYYGLIGETRKEMSTLFRHLFSDVEKKGSVPESITDSILMDFLTNELKKTNNGTMARSLRAIKYISDYLKIHGLEHLEMDFNQLKVKNSRVRAIPPYTQEEIRKILDSVDTSTNEGLRDYAILLLAYDTGLRSVDIRTLCLPDIDWNNSRVLINQSKTSKSLILPLNGHTMNAIADYILLARPECDYNEVFLNIKNPIKPMDKRYHCFSNLMTKYCKKAGVEKIPKRSFHSLRRSFATGLSAAGVPVETISQMLGHKDINAGKPYLSYNRKQISFCAIGFDEIPIRCGIYIGVNTDMEKGGDGNGIS